MPLFKRFIFLSLLLLFITFVSPVADSSEISISKAVSPIVIAHRGASGYLPEHSLAAYELAIELGADYIEPDLVFTKDGILVARHDHYLSTTTDVADHVEFKEREKEVDGRKDWFTEDFTLEELKTLGVKQAFKGRDASQDGKHQIATFQEIIDLVKRKREESGKTVGLYPEAKLPGYFEGLGFDYASVLVTQLEKNALNSVESPVYIQSFEAEILRKLNKMTEVQLVQLVAPREMNGLRTSNIPLADISEYADGVGPSMILLVDKEGKDSGFVESAHSLGLQVHVWTFRDDAYRSDVFGTAEVELTYFLNMGIDGFFTDFPDTGVKIRDKLFYQPDFSQWSHYGGNQLGMQYSSLKNITRENVSKLKIAWQYRTGELSEGAARPYSFQSNPILVRNKLYLSTSSGIVIALDPQSGTEVWRYDPKLDRSRSPAEISNRGVSSWIDPKAKQGAVCSHRIYIGILDSRLIALDGNTGKPCANFGEGGAIFLNKGVRLRPGESLEYTLTSPPVIVGETLISGSAVGDNSAVELEYGIVRGFDVRTGEMKWSWDPIPRSPENPVHKEWLPQQVKKTGAANAWAPLAADVRRGLVFVPTGSASPDFFGGERQGSNLYANSLVALNAETGELVWAQQLIHHDVWDYDLASQPTLVDLKRGDKVIPAVLQGTKTGLIFTFHRETGEPIFEIEERAVPQGGAEGEDLSPTQPFPVAPPPLVRQGPVTKEDAYGFLLVDKWLCQAELAKYRSEGIYTPPSVEGTILLPSWGGGINWGGLAFDPESQTVVVNTNDLAAVVALIPRSDYSELAGSGTYPDSQFSAQSGTPFGMRRQPVLSVLGAPCIKPPWGNLTAVDMTDGSIKWQRPLGTTEDLAPWPMSGLELGMPNLGGPVVTASGVIFIAAATDNYLRAFDLDKGEELWKGRLPAGGQATPMTYYLESTGKQYVVIAVGGHPGLGTTLGDYVVAFSL